MPQGTTVGTFEPAGNSFFGALAQNAGLVLGQTVGVAAQALPIWTAQQIDRRLYGNSLANPTFYAPAAGMRLDTPLYSTKPFAQPAILEQTGPAVLTMGQGIILIAAAVAGLIIILR